MVYPRLGSRRWLVCQLAGHPQSCIKNLVLQEVLLVYPQLGSRRWLVYQLVGHPRPLSKVLVYRALRGV